MKKKALIMISLILLSSVILLSPTTIALDPFTIRGYVYIDGVITEPEDVILTLAGEDIVATTYNDGYYEITGEGETGDTGTFTVIYLGSSYFATETVLITGDYIYRINLTIDTTPLPNNPPDKPINPSPEDNSENISFNPTLSVYVSDPDDDTMNVSFYNATDSSLIGAAADIASGSTASFVWPDLSYNTIYSWYARANDSEFENKSDTWSFTTEEETENNPPDKPINPSPEDNSENIDLSPTLSVYVSDPDDGTMNVSFYNASDDSLIDIATNVANGNTATITWPDRSYNTIYSWYAVANDSEFENKSDTWSFTTKENIAPTVEITKPENALYLFNIKIRNHRLQFRKPLIFGRITIEANATDEDSGIEKVEFYINGKLMENDTTYPYTYNWTRDWIRLIHIFKIKVIAYANDGETAEDYIIVRKFL